MSSLLYPSSVTRLSVDNFCDTVKNDPDSFAHFKVLRITHIKNLVSVVWHEYVQVIVRDTSNGKLHRIIVERQTDNDYVIIGMWKPWTEGETPSSGDGDPWLPLPLFSLFFNTPLALSDVANHIRAVRAVHKDYNVLQANCYWFALSLYTNLYASAGGTATEKKWTWWLFRGIIPTYISWWDMATRAPKVQLYRTAIYCVHCFLTTSLSQMISATLFKRDDMLNVEVCKILYSYLHILMVFAAKTSMRVAAEEIEIKPLRFAKLQVVSSHFTFYIPYAENACHSPTWTTSMMFPLPMSRRTLLPIPRMSPLPISRISLLMTTRLSLLGIHLLRDS